MLNVYLANRARVVKQCHQTVIFFFKCKYIKKKHLNIIECANRPLKTEVILEKFIFKYKNDA